MSRWPNVALGEVLTKSDDWIRLDPEREYKEVTVRNRGQGAVLRRVASGAEIAGSRRLRVHSRQFIISRIDARHGSSALIPEELDGAIVTNDFPVFDCDVSVLQPGYLKWYTKTPQFVDECRQASEGSTNRVRLKEPALLSIKMPLPPVDVQRQVVRKIEELNSCVLKLRTLTERQQLVELALLQSTRDALLATGRNVSLSEVLLTSCGGAWGDMDDDDGAGVLRSNAIDDMGHLTLRDVRFRNVWTSTLDKLALADGDLIMTKSNALDLVGNVAVFHQPADGRQYIPSNFLQLLRIDRSLADPAYIWHCLQSRRAKEYWRSEASGSSPSLQNLNGRKIRAFRFCLPSLQDQAGLARRLDEAVAASLRRRHLRTHFVDVASALLSSGLSSLMSD